MTQLARIETEQDGTRCVVRVHGEIDMSNATEMSTAIEGAMPNSTVELVIDLTHTSYIDSAGVAFLLRLAERLKSRRQALRLVVPAEAPVRGVLELTGVHKLVPLDAVLAEPSS